MAILSSIAVTYQSFFLLQNHIQPPKILKIAKYFFVTIFIIEVLLKWVGLGIRKYFRDDWNKFDFTIATLGLFITIYVSNVLLGDVKSLKMFKVAKMYTLIKALSSLRSFEIFRIINLTSKPIIKLKKMTNNIILSIPIMLQMVMTLILLFYWYALLGISLFN